jgi:hypothetical protein
MAKGLVAEVLAEAHTRGLKAKEQRRRIRAAFAKTIVPAWVRYAAVKAVAGVSMLDLPDARQPHLLDRGPRRRTTRKKVPRG